MPPTPMLPHLMHLGGGGGAGFPLQMQLGQGLPMFQTLQQNASEDQSDEESSNHVSTGYPNVPPTYLGLPYDPLHEGTLLVTHLNVLHFILTQFFLFSLRFSYT